MPGEQGLLGNTYTFKEIFLGSSQILFRETKERLLRRLENTKMSILVVEDTMV